VRAHASSSHEARGWEKLTDLVIDALDASPRRIVFAPWGNYAQKKGKRVDTERHVVVTGANPSPLSAKPMRRKR
jgi:uracil-DNA glycosylase